MPQTDPRSNGPVGYQFGAFKGVFTPSILTILGVVMYLRFGWVLGNVGLPLTLLIVTLASMITFLTGLSLSALATNRRIEGGGAYFIISRSLGIEAGAAVGLPLFFAQALGISFYTAGFAESVINVFPRCVPDLILLAGLPRTAADAAAAHSAQIVGLATLVILTAIAYKSADLALKVQFFVMAMIGISLVSFFLGGAPDYLSAPARSIAPKHFWAVFAVFFPAVTGIEAGICMSGDLKNPSHALPRGTIAAVLTGYTVYMIIPCFLAYLVADRQILLAEPMIMRHVARVGSLIVLGVWAASLSSAMGALLGAPRTLQALARDRVIPRLLAKGFGPGNDPRIATATAFLVAGAGILLGDLNLIAPVLSMFFLTSYGLLNISAGLEELTGPPSWRPTFRIPWIVSLLGAFLCVAAMFMINAGATFVAGFVSGTVFFAMRRRSLKARWGDLRNALLMHITRWTIHNLAKGKVDERTWKPNILVLSGSPTARWHLIELASAIAHNRSLMTVATVLPPDTAPERTDSITGAIADYLAKRRIRALVKVYPADSPLEGARMLVRTYGYGPIAPNTILIGRTGRPENYEDFARFVQTVGALKQNLIIVRESEDETVKAALPEEPARIVLWWYGTQQNLGLMLALTHLLQQSPDWNGAELLIKSIVSSGQERDEVQKRLDDFIARVRISASAEVLMKAEGDVFPAIRENSRDADLVFLGMRAPAAGEEASAYRDYYAGLMSRTEGLPPTAFVLAAENVDFFAIFDEV